jgi:hypothetical protein
MINMCHNTVFPHETRKLNELEWKLYSFPTSKNEKKFINGFNLSLLKLDCNYVCIIIIVKYRVSKMHIILQKKIISIPLNH